MKWIAVLLALHLSVPAFAALPGVTRLDKDPGQITDAELAKLLGPRVKAADVVALGETVHGSSGFLRLQTRLIRYLVVNHGLRLIAWENPTLRSLELARWVSSCAKTKTPAPVDVLYMPTLSDPPLWDWICDFNRAHAADPVIFRGIDIWDRPWEHYLRIAASARSVGIDPAISKRIASCPVHQARSWSDVELELARLQPDGTVFATSEYETCRSALTRVLDSARSIGAERKKQAADAAEAYELALSASTLLGWLGFYHYYWSDDVLSWNARDESQGRNLALLMEKHDMARAIISAHTSHVSHNRSPADWWGFGDIKSGIFFFAKATKKKVFNIAFTAYEASGTQGEWSLPTAPNSLDRKLHDAGHTLSFFFADAAFISQHPKWWIQNQNYPGRYESGVELVLRDHFDGFFFFDRSHLDKALPARPMWQP
jgi:erythromycin esterase-like protein